MEVIQIWLSADGNKLILGFAYPQNSVDGVFLGKHRVAERILLVRKNGLWCEKSL